MKRPLAPRFLLLLTLALLASAAQAQWKWIDAAGNVQYSDRPPPQGTPEKNILQHPPTRDLVVVQPYGAAAANAAAAAASAASAARSAASDARAEAERQARLKQEQDQKARADSEERKNAAQHAENCRTARSQLQMLDSGMRMTHLNDKGEPVVMDDAARAAEIQHASDIAAQECK